VPTVGSANNIFIADFNGDGRNDVFIVDQGLEDVDCSIGCSGGRNVVLLSQPDGRLKDVTATSLAGQPTRFNHVSAMADLNGDGAPDIILAIIGGPTPSGIALLMNDGKGAFTETTRGLPPEIAWTATANYGSPFQSIGTVAVGDLDGDGVPEIVTATYNSGDWVVVGGKGSFVLSERTIRVFKADAEGEYSEAWRARIPDALAQIPYAPNSSAGLGASGIKIVDVDQDGRPDLLVLWEGGAVPPNYLEFLKNQGNLQFEDLTLRQFGSYRSQMENTIDVNDVNGDGVPDLLLRDENVATATLATPQTPLFLNDGAGHLLPLQPSYSGQVLSTDQMVATLAPPCPRLSDCIWVKSNPLLFDLNGDGIRDLVLIDNGMEYSPPPGVNGIVDVYALISQPPAAKAPSSIAPTGTINQRTFVNTAFFARLQATVRDSARRAVPNVTVTFNAPGAGASGTFAGSSTIAIATTNAAGIATSPVFTANGVVGAFQITAMAPGTGAPAVFSLTNVPPPPVISAVNVADGGTDLAQNTWIVIRGTNLAPPGVPAGGVDWSSAPEFSTGQMPTQLPGFSVTVTVNGKPAYLYFLCRAATGSNCASDQINVLTPLDNTVGAVQIVVTRSGVSSAPFTVNLRAAAPAFPLVGVTNYAVATHADYSLIGPTPLSVPGYAFSPARPGETITIYGFGFGLPKEALTAGSSSQSGVLPVLPSIEMGGLSAAVTFAGLISPGLYQLNVVVPDAMPDGDSSLRCVYNGFSSAAGALITIAR
jgi:uncharacterized protein (TIGR03437 family)